MEKIITKTCYKCSGYGYIFDAECPKCHGTGIEEKILAHKLKRNFKKCLL